MGLRDWVAATATVATTATLAPPNPPTVARVASVAVATAANGPHTPATPAEAAELRTLIERVLADCPAEIEETVQVALADVDDALVCFRALVADLPVYTSPLPELPTCKHCRNLTTTRDRDGCRRCLAAGRGELADVHRRYCPDPTTPRRCLAFLPASSCSDQRGGALRWPWLDGAA